MFSNNILYIKPKPLFPTWDSHLTCPLAQVINMFSLTCLTLIFWSFPQRLYIILISVYSNSVLPGVQVNNFGIISDSHLSHHIANLSEIPLAIRSKYIKIVTTFFHLKYYNTLVAANISLLVYCNCLLNSFCFYLEPGHFIVNIL